jgi:hypothetical protein
MISFSFSSRGFVFVKVSRDSFGACDVCIAGILFFVELVTGLLGTLTTSGENWSLFPLFLACWITTGSSISFSLFLTEISGENVVVFDIDEGVSLMLYGMLK